VPGKIFRASAEIGSQAVLRSRVTTSRPRQARRKRKDFKVVVTLAIRQRICGPGLFHDGQIKTAEGKCRGYSYPSAGVRTRKDLEKRQEWKKQGSSNVTLAAPPPPAPGDPKKDEVQACS